MCVLIMQYAWKLQTVYVWYVISTNKPREITIKNGRAKFVSFYLSKFNFICSYENY